MLTEQRTHIRPWKGCGTHSVDPGIREMLATCKAILTPAVRLPDAPVRDALVEKKVVGGSWVATILCFVGSNG